MDAVAEWWLTAGEQFREILQKEVTEHFLHVNRDGDVHGYAILSLVSDYPEPSLFETPVQKVDVTFNRESDLKPEKREDFYYRHSANEWSFYKEDAFPKAQEVLVKLNQEFEALHTTPGEAPVEPSESRINRAMFYGYDQPQIDFGNRIHKTMLDVLMQLRQEGVLSSSVFTIVWAPDSPDDIFYCSAKKLNPPEVFERFWNEFRDDTDIQDCSVFEC